MSNGVAPQKPGWKTTEAGFSGGALAFLAWLSTESESPVVVVACICGIVCLSIAYARLRTEAKTPE